MKIRIAIFSIAFILVSAFLGERLFRHAQVPLDQNKSNTFDADGWNREVIKRYPEELQEARSISGFIDHHGHFAFKKLNPVQGHHHFSEGLCFDSAISLNSDKAIGFQDKQGNLVIDFSKAGIHVDADFSEDLVPAFIEEGGSSGKWGFIDKAGRFVIAPQFQNAHSFSQGFAPVKLQGHWGFIDKSGKWLIKPVFDNARPFSGGMATVSSNGKVGYVDLNGKLVVKPQYDLGFAFSEGVAQVVNRSVGGPRKSDVADGKSQFLRRYINISGKTVFIVENTLDTEGDILGFYFSDQKSLPYEPGFLKGSSDANEHLQSTTGFDYFDLSFGKFLNDRAPFFNKDGFGYLDKRGSIAIPFKFYSAMPFSEDLACVSVISEKPEIDYVKETIDHLTNFFDKSALGRIEVPKHSYGFIDKNGNFAIKPIYEEARNFHEGLAFVVRADGTMGFIDKNERMVITVKSKVSGAEISDFYDGLAGVGPLILYVPADRHSAAH